MNLSRYPPEHWGLLMSSIISLIFLTPLADYELLLSGKSLCTRYNAYASHPSSLLSCTSPGSQKKKKETLAGQAMVKLLLMGMRTELSSEPETVPALSSWHGLSSSICSNTSSLSALFPQKQQKDATVKCCKNSSNF